MPTHRLPVIDISTLSRSRPLRNHGTARELCKAFEEVGFAYIVGHGLSKHLIESAFDQSRLFHESPLQQKRTLSINSAHRGYMGFATSTVITSTINNNTHPNLSESFMLMHELEMDDPDLIEGNPLAGPNQWPCWLPDFKPVIQKYAQEMEKICAALLLAFETGLDLPRGFFTPLFANPVTFLRMLRYPPQLENTDRNQYGSAPHTDYGCMTLLAQDSLGGLEVRHPQAGWIAIPPIKGSLLLNAGDLMPIWTNGRIKSTPHRVTNNSGSDRYSMPFFYDPNMKAIIEPVYKTGEDRGIGILYGDYLMSRLTRNYSHNLKTINSYPETG